MKLACVLALSLCMLSLQGCDRHSERNLRLRASNGEAQAQLELGWIHLVGSQQTPKDEAQAELLLSAAARQGLSDADYALGLHLTASDSTRRADGLTHLEAASRAGNVRAQDALATQLGPVNLDRSIEWRSKAAHAGFEPAFLGLAIALEKRATPDDLVLAYAWMSVAADRQPGLREHGMVSLAARLTPAQLEEAKLVARAKRSDLRLNK